MNRLIPIICIAMSAAVGALGGFTAGVLSVDFSRNEEFRKGVRLAWEEINHGLYGYGPNHLAVPLYEDGEPCSILFIVPDTKKGEKRHMMVRKVGCGSHWELPPGACFDSEGIAFGDEADYVADLMERYP